MTIERIDNQGRVISHLPAMHCEDDVEFCATRYPHPDITSGQHTNGPRSIWIRRIGGEWIQCRENALHSAVMSYVEMGFEWFEEDESEANE